MTKPNENFKMDGSPHRPLQHVEWSKNLRGEVASTGNSSLASVLESLKVFGGRGYFNPKQEHWLKLQEQYRDERDMLQWVETGRHFYQKGSTPRQSARNIAKQLLDLVKI